MLDQRSWACHIYDALISLPVIVQVGNFGIDKPLLLWINDGLMAIFFFLVGLELKRECLQGNLSDPKEVALPAVGAFGGMLMPALIYAAINWSDPVALKGWAVPTATDIAFALAILGLLGDRVPVALKVLLVSIAIFDDVGAIVIIALFYTEEISATALMVTTLCLLLLLSMNRKGVMKKTPYILIGLVMWVSLLKSGVHATLAGVLIALFIPIRNQAQEASPLHELEADLHTSVSFIILPVFAFANSGITLSGVTLDSLWHPIPLGILTGLFIGKQMGVMLFFWLSIQLRIARLPTGVRWSHLYGTALLCGIGFTMSLFISSLAFQEARADLVFDERLGIIVGSILSGICGYLMLKSACRSKG